MVFLVLGVDRVYLAPDGIVRKAHASPARREENGLHDRRGTSQNALHLVHGKRVSPHHTQFCQANELV